MKITRERFEQILREEIAAVKEGSQWDLPKDRFSPDYKPAPEEEAEFAKHRERGKKKWERPQVDPDDPFKGATKDVQVYNEEADDLESMRRDLENAASDAKGKKKGSALGAAAKGAFKAGGIYQAMQALQGLAAMGSAAMEKAMSKLDPEMVAAIADAAQSVGSAIGLEEGYGEEEHTPMMPPKAIKKKGIDVPLTKLADGADAARAAVEAMYSPSSREYERAMMVIDMAEAQGALNEDELEEATLEEGRCPPGHYWKSFGGQGGTCVKDPDYKGPKSAYSQGGTVSPPRGSYTPKYEE